MSRRWHLGRFPRRVSRGSRRGAAMRGRTRALRVRGGQRHGLDNRHRPDQRTTHECSSLERGASVETDPLGLPWSGYPTHHDPPGRLLDGASPPGTRHWTVSSRPSSKWSPRNAIGRHRGTHHPVTERSTMSDLSTPIRRNDYALPGDRQANRSATAGHSRCRVGRGHQPVQPPHPGCGAAELHRQRRVAAGRR